MLVPTPWCPMCRHSLTSWAPGPGRRPDAKCPRCASLERHRLAALVFDWLAPLLQTGLVVEAAPTPAVRRMLLDTVGRERYLGFDLGLDTREIDVYADLTRLPFGDGAIHALVCFHVLEHVPDDAAAIAELARVLSSDGFALVMNPWTRHSVTSEDPDAPEEERIRRFGQADHVRLYGTDFEDRLEAAGFDVHRFEPLMALPTELVMRANLSEEPLWVLTAAGPTGARVRQQLRQLLPPGTGDTPLLAASAVAPVLVAASDGALLARGARTLREVSGLAVGEDLGALEQLHRLVAIQQRAGGERRRLALRQIAALDRSVRDQLGAGADERWAELLPGLTSESGRALVERVLSGCPDAQVVHLVETDTELSAGDLALAGLAREAGPRRYLRVDPTADDAAHRVARFVQPVGRSAVPVG